MAIERFFKDLSNGHEFFIDQAYGLATISKTSCPEFSVATVIRHDPRVTSVDDYQSSVQWLFELAVGDGTITRGYHLSLICICES